MALTCILQGGVGVTAARPHMAHGRVDQQPCAVQVGIACHILVWSPDSRWVVATGASSAPGAPTPYCSVILSRQLEEVYTMPEAWTLSWLPESQCAMGLGYSGDMLSWQAQPSSARELALQAAARLLQTRPGGHSAVDLQCSAQGGLCVLFDQHLVIQLLGSDSKTVSLGDHGWREAIWSPAGSHVLCVRRHDFVLVDAAAARLAGQELLGVSVVRDAASPQPCFSPCGSFLAWVAQDAGLVQLRVATVQLRPLFSCPLDDQPGLDLISCKFSAWGDQIHVLHQLAGVTMLTVVSFSPSPDWQVPPLIAALRAGLGNSSLSVSCVDLS